MVWERKLEQRAREFPRSPKSSFALSAEARGLWKDGIRYTRRGEVQRYFGRSCSFRFSESTLNSEVKLDITRQVFKKPDPREDFSESDVLPIDLSVEPPP
jgi:hypothetical protein